MRKHLFVCLLVFGAAYFVRAQNNDLKIIPPSPSVAELGRFGLAAANLSDGSFTTQIPVYQYSTKNISIPITLSYSTNGLQVNKVASRVGMDWSLMAGGSIGKMVLGGSDDAVSWATYPSGWPSTTGSALTNFLTSVVGGTVETVPDIYNFSFNGYSGRFLYINSQVIKLEQNSLNIVKNSNGFEVTDNNGIKYEFYNYEESLSSSSCSGHPYAGAGWMRNSWMLTKIIHPLGDTVFFKYKNVTFNYDSGISETYTSAPELGSESCISGNCPNLPVSVKCTSTIQNHGLILDMIYSNYRGLVKFNYVARQDVPGDSAILGIKVFDATANPIGSLVNYYNTDPIKTFWFEYEFPTCLGGSVGGNATSKRMYLDMFQECDNSTGICKDYRFMYNSLDALPKRLSFAQDHFGYYNGKTSNQSLIPAPTNPAHYNLFVSHGFGDRNPDPHFAQMGCLSKITYPTGGTDSIVYESHTVYHSGGFNCSNPNVTKTAEADGNSQLKKVHYYYSDVFTVNCSQTVSLNIGNIPLSGNIDYPIHSYYVGACFVDVTGDEIYDPNTPCNGIHEQNYHPLTAAPLDWEAYLVDIPPGTYRLRLQVQGPTRGHADFTFTDNNDNSGNRNISGVRVKKIMSLANANDVPLEHKYYYAATNSTHSSGNTTVENPVYSSPFVNTLPCYNPAGGCTPQTCLYTQYTSDNFYSLYTYGGNHIYYNTVTEDLGNNFANGYVEHSFVIAHDAAATPLLSSIAKGTPLSNFNILNGFEYLTKFYRNTGTDYQLVKQVRKTRVDDSRLRVDNSFYAFKAEGGYASGCLIGANTLPEVRNLHVAQFYLMSKWIYNDSTITTEYDDHGGQLTSTSVVTYDNITHQQPTKSESFDSKGTSISTQTIYPTDSYTYSEGTANTAKASLESLHMYAMPLDVKNYRGTTLLNETENNYSNALLSVPVLSKVYQAIASNPKFLQTEFTQYGTGGILLDAKQKGTDKISFIWDYKKIHPIAQVVNALTADIAYSSFEADGSGNWTFTGSPSPDATAPTGKYVYNLANGSMTKTISSSAAYIISYWLPVSSSALSITGTVSGYPIQGRTVNGWKYYEHKISGQSSVSLGTSGLIDEVRLYPANAQMTTYTYDPLIGISSQCDANNRTSYYEYDEMRRLKLIRDQDRNIIKRICYNFEGQPEGCTVIPNWQWTGNIRCKPCPSNSTYFMNMRQNEEKDLNPESPTYNQLRWTDAGTSSSCVPVADWQNTATAIRCKTISGDNTGQQEQEQKDMNPCSATYNQIRWVVIGTNLTSCPIPCNSSNCWGDNKKCVGGICETGTRYNKSTVKVEINGVWYWRCTYYYCFSDATASADFIEYNGSACSVGSQCLLD
jgi:hypothetical protein